MSLKTSDTSFWDQRRNKIHSRKGGYRIGEDVYLHGNSLLGDLIYNASYMQVVVLNATGKYPSKAFTQWLESLFIALSWPDPRIWCNHMGALAGTTRSSVIAATTMGVLAADSRFYGIGTVIVQGVSFIQDAMERHQKGDAVKDIVYDNCKLGKPYIMGYARPLASGDERVEAMIKIADSLGFEQGEHMKLAFQIHDILQNEFNESININGYLSAFFSDQGYTPIEVCNILSCLVASGVTGCYVEESDKPGESFLPMRCDDIEYTGPAPRSLGK